MANCLYDSIAVQQQGYLTYKQFNSTHALPTNRYHYIFEVYRCKKAMDAAADADGAKTYPADAWLALF